ncbi:MAG: FUSC family protein [Solirubrobacterales bacterium]|nr:FUSC family protein [Solirubrobacterales bacterium]
MTLARAHLRRPSRSSLEVAARAAIAAAVATWAATRIGLKDPYWAGISAVIASAGTLGASLGASVSRVSATVVGLLVGLAVVALPVAGTLLSGLAVFIALVVLAALSLDAGARLGAATTLIVTSGSSHSALTSALARGANVPFGCAVAVAAGLVLWPHRAARQLGASLRADIEHAGALIQSALLAYLGVAVDDDLQLESDRLNSSNPARTAMLKDAALEPELRGERLRILRRNVASAQALIEGTCALMGPCLEGSNDHASALVQNELERVAEAVATTAREVGAAQDGGRSSRDGLATLDDRVQESLMRLASACAALEAAFARARVARQTVPLAAAELGRLLSIIRGVQNVSSVLSRFSPSAPIERP